MSDNSKGALIGAAALIIGACIPVCYQELSKKEAPLITGAFYESGTNAPVRGEVRISGTNCAVSIEQSGYFEVWKCEEVKSLNTIHVSVALSSGSYCDPVVLNRAPQNNVVYLSLANAPKCLESYTDLIPPSPNDGGLIPDVDAAVSEAIVQLAPCPGCLQRDSATGNCVDPPRCPDVCSIREPPGCGCGPPPSCPSGQKLNDRCQCVDRCEGYMRNCAQFGGCMLQTSGNGSACNGRKNQSQADGCWQGSPSC